MSLKLRETVEADLDYVISAEHSEENCRFVFPWSREKHLQSLTDRDLAHLMVQGETRVGYVILAGLLDPNKSIELRRIVITEKGRGYGKASVALVKGLAFETCKAHSRRGRGCPELRPHRRQLIRSFAHNNDEDLAVPHQRAPEIVGGPPPAGIRLSREWKNSFLNHPASSLPRHFVKLG